MQNCVLLSINLLENRIETRTPTGGRLNPVISCYCQNLLLIIIFTNALQKIKNIIITQKSLLREFKEDEKMESSMNNKNKVFIARFKIKIIMIMIITMMI